MRIIKEGKLPDEEIYEATCRYCKTHFEFAEKEAQRVEDQRDGSYLKVNCPLCGRDVTQNL